MHPDDLAPEWRELWEERAAIMQYEGKQPREQAEAFALTDIMRQIETTKSQLLL